MNWIRPAAIFDGTDLLFDHCVGWEEDEIVAIAPSREVANPTDATGKVLAPGLFDVQVNGGGGVMLNSTPTRDTVRTISRAHRELHTSFILPTVITDRPEIMSRAADAVIAETGQNGVLGIHIEGPHISLQHKGTHNPEYIRPFDQDTLHVLERLRTQGIPVLLTLAPEAVPVETIAQVARMGVIVAAGHSAATAEQTEQALAAGLTGFTHLYNGMPQPKSREPGIVVAAINSDAYCGIIADGHHVDDRLVALTFRARSLRGRMVTVSDAMSTIGGPGHFELYGETISVSDGRLVNAAGSLAGAHIDLRSSVERLISTVGVGLADVLHSAITAPRDYLRVGRQKLIGSHLEDVFFATLPLAREPLKEVQSDLEHACVQL